MKVVFRGTFSSHFSLFKSLGGLVVGGAFKFLVEGVKGCFDTARVLWTGRSHR